MYNKLLALSSFFSLGKKFKHHAEFAEECKSTVNDYIKKNHAVKLSLEEVKHGFLVTNHVPHHGVVNVNKPCKVRILFDTAVKI